MLPGTQRVFAATVFLSVSLALAALLPTTVIAGQYDGPSQYIYLAEYSQLKHMAEMGDRDAQFQMANIYYAPPDRSGFAQNYRHAFQLYLQAALRGHATAQHNVGAMFGNGDYVVANAVEAVAWFKLAAYNGDAAGKRKAAEAMPQLTEAEKDATEKRFQVLLQEVTQAQKLNDFRPQRLGIDIN